MLGHTTQFQKEQHLRVLLSTLNMMETINPPVFQGNSTLLIKDDIQTIIGFKTIRFTTRVDHVLNDVQETDEELAELMVELTKDTFPCARIIVDIRSDTVLQAESMKEKQGFIEVLAIKGAADLDERNARLREIAVRFGDQAYFLDSTEWTKTIRVLNAVVEWLGFHRSCFFFSRTTRTQYKGNGLRPCSN